MAKVKDLYRGAFSYAHQVQILYAHAYTERQAWAIMCRRLSKIHDVGLPSVFNMFNGKKDNYTITREMVFWEGEEL